MQRAKLIETQPAFETKSTAATWLLPNFGGTGNTRHRTWILLTAPPAIRPVHSSALSTITDLIPIIACMQAFD
jgi:hypothetical protein